MLAAQEFAGPEPHAVVLVVLADDVQHALVGEHDLAMPVENEDEVADGVQGPGQRAAPEVLGLDPDLDRRGPVGRSETGGPGLLECVHGYTLGTIAMR